MSSFDSSIRELPVVEGDLREFAADAVSCMQNLQREHGNLVALRHADQQLIFGFGAELNREILSRADLFHSRFFAMRGPKNSAQRNLTSGLLSMNGAEHASQRRVVKTAFEKRAVPGYAPAIAKHATAMLDGWQHGEVRDIANEMTKLMLRITSSMLFGMDAFDLALETGVMMDEWVRLNHELGMSALLADNDSFAGYEYLLSFAEELEGRVREIIALRQRQPAGENAADVLSSLLRAQASGAAISESQLIGQVALVFAAAHMTTAHTLSWTMFLLAQHPDILDQLFVEVTGSEDTIHSAGLAGDTATLLERVIKESMRILPASAYSQRVCNRSVELAGFPVPAGSVVIFSQLITHRIEPNYHEPDVFDPDRWLTLKPGAYEYLPFGAGPRLCIGGSLASSVLRMVIPMILRRFRPAMVPHSKVEPTVVSTMLSPDSGLHVRLLEPDTKTDAVPLSGSINRLLRVPSLTERTLVRAA